MRDLIYYFDSTKINWYSKAEMHDMGSVSCRSIHYAQFNLGDIYIYVKWWVTSLSKSSKCTGQRKKWIKKSLRSLFHVNIILSLLCVNTYGRRVPNSAWNDVLHKLTISAKSRFTLSTALSMKLMFGRPLQIWIKFNLILQQ